MASGKVHAAGCVVLATLPPIISAATGLDWHRTAWLSFGALAGMLLTPDLDVRGSVRAYAMAWRAGWLFGAFWRALWWPYSRIIPRHRHWLSHLPIVGTMGRLIYLWLACFGIAQLCGVSLPRLPVEIAAGLMAADALHWIFDRFPVYG